MSDNVVFKIELNELGVIARTRFSSDITRTQLDDLLHASIHNTKEPEWFASWITAENAAKALRDRKAVSFAEVTLQHEQIGTNRTAPAVKAPRHVMLHGFDEVNEASKYSAVSALQYLLQGLFFIKASRSYHYPEIPPCSLPRNISIRSTLQEVVREEYSSRPEGTLDPHDHRMHHTEVLAKILNDELLYKGIWNQTGDRQYALHPLFSMSPEELWTHLRAQTSLVQFVQDYVLFIVQNLTSSNTTWYPVHPEMQISDKETVHFSMGSELACKRCGMSLAVYGKVLDDNGQFEIKVGTTEYALRNAHPKLTICNEDALTNNLGAKIEVPSGEIIFADWIRAKAFTKSVERENQYDTSRWHSINYLLGRIQQIHHYAGKNVAFGSVGNETVTIYQSDEGLVIAGLSDINPEMVELYFEDEDGDLDDEAIDKAYQKAMDHYQQVTESTGLENIGGVCTDLWGYTIVDKAIADDLVGIDLFTSKEITLNANHQNHAGGSTPSLVSIPAGTYTHLYLHHLSTEEAMAHLPESLQEKLRPHQFRVIHGALLKTSE